MACRRRLRALRRNPTNASLGAYRRLWRAYAQASQVLLTCWACEEMFPVVPLLAVSWEPPEIFLYS